MTQCITTHAKLGQRIHVIFTWIFFMWISCEIVTLKLTWKKYYVKFTWKQHFTRYSHDFLNEYFTWNLGLFLHMEFFHRSFHVNIFMWISHAAILAVYRLNCQTCHRQWGQMKVKTQWEEWQIKNNKCYSPKHRTEKLNTIYMYMYKERQAKYGSTHANYPLYF